MFFDIENHCRYFINNRLLYLEGRLFDVLAVEQVVALERKAVDRGCWD
jgi:hypothetical protein